MSETVVVTGGAGFLGSHLCEALLRRGDRVICIDNFVTGQRKNVELFADKNFVCLEANVSDAILVDEPVDVVCHLASPASPDDFSRLPFEILRVGSEGTMHALQLAEKNSARFLLASTSEVYGEPLEHPQSETYWGNVNPNGPRSVYDEAKRFAEAATMAYQRFANVDTKIVRIFNTYGPRMRSDDGRVVTNLLSQALRNQPLTIYGDGSQTRSFCFVDDQIAAQLLMIDAQHPGPLNCGNDQEKTILELAQKAIAVTNSNSEIIFGARPQDDPTRRCPDLRQTTAALGWAPTTSLETGLRITATYLAKELGL